MQFKYIAFVSIALLILFDCSQGCTTVGRNARAKRSVSNPAAPKLFIGLADFFGKCRELIDVSTNLFTLQSVVDYTIRDSDWYKDFSTSICAGSNDNAQCWRDALKYFITASSKLYNATGKCIDQWFEKGNRCPKSATNVVYRIAVRQATRCPNAYSRSSHNIYARQTTQQPLQCAACRLTAYQLQYPSLKRFDRASIVTFLNDHYTYCRLDPKGIRYHLTWQRIRNTRTLIRQFSPSSRCLSTSTGNAWRNDFDQLFSVASRMDGPIWESYKACPRPGPARSRLSPPEKTS